MKNYSRLVVGALGAALLAGACQDLEVTNPNQPDVQRILLDPSDVQALVASAWRPYWDNNQGNTSGTGIVISAMADEFTATSANFGVLDLSSEPRAIFNNDPAYANRFVNQGPWYDWYGGISNANAGLRYVNAGNHVDIGGVDQTARTRAFAKFAQGLLHATISLYYDRAYIVSEGTDLNDPKVLAALQLKPYTEVRDSALAMLREAATLSSQNTFTLPATWINGLALTNTDLARLANTYAARLMVYSARSSAERKAVNWAAVAQLVDAGITADHAPVGEVNVLSSAYKQYSQFSTNTPAAQRQCNAGTTIHYRADYKLIGPADTTGQYQQWLAKPVDQRTRFTLHTPDRRIEGAGTPPADGPVNGSYFRYCTTDINFTPSRGTYHFSAYQWFRLGGRYRDGALPLIFKTEMDLLKAEALLETGNAAGAAALINLSRQAQGKLPAVTAAGVPESRSCVPKTATGACGSLRDALMYEKGIEVAGSDPYVRWFDGRGWGLLPKGTLLHFPIPGREFAAAGIESYTLGGSLPGSAP
ncbi:MAG: hypothetical protein JO040_12275 [Gemmatimonadetes bacterium]|nr:hypothetical protein [Gemmatimonadota bacterium]